MNKQDFNSILKGDRKAETSEILSLEALLNSYPFFSLGQCLYLNCLKETSVNKYDNQLLQRAPLISNRVLLKSVDNGQFITNNDISAIEIAPISNEKTAIETVENEMAEEQQKAIKDEKSSKKKKKKKKDKKQKNERNPSKEIITELIQSENSGLQILKELELKNTATKHSQSSSNEIPLKLNSNKPLEEKSESKIEQHTSHKQPTNYTEWLLSKAKKEPAQEKSQKPQATFSKTDDNLATVSEILGNKKQTKKISEQELLKNFLENKSVQRERIKVFNADLHLNKSIEDNSSIVTETLAKIYAAQGLDNKAIEVYKKLMLLNPEKSTYFADLIDKLDKH